MEATFRLMRHLVSLTVRPTLDALWYGRHLPWNLRWRLLAFQPVHLLGNLAINLPYLFCLRRPFVVDHIPVESNRELRVLVFYPPATEKEHNEDQTSQPAAKLRPLHIDCHGGGYIGGYPESQAPFCSYLARSTGAVVVSVSHRVAPVHPFPAAIDDVHATVAWLRDNAASRYGADPDLITLSGSSAGGGLMLAATQALSAIATSSYPDSQPVKAYVGFYPSIDLRPAPWEKPKPDHKAIQRDPLSFLQPLMDSYAAPRKADMGDSPRMNPCLADVSTLPRRMLLVVPRIDVLPRELFEFVERVKRDDEARGDTSRVVDTMYLEDLFHGFIEVPDVVVPWSKKKEVFDRAIRLIRDTHLEHGWSHKPQ